MKKLLLLMFTVLSLSVSAQLQKMAGAWELQNRDGLLSYTIIVLNDAEDGVEGLNSSTRDLQTSATENIVSQSENEIITNYGFSKLGYNLITKTFLHKNVLHRVILRSKDTLRYKLIYK